MDSVGRQILSYLLPSCCRNLRPLLAKALLWSSDFFSFCWGEGMSSVTHFPLLLGHQYFPLNRGVWSGNLSSPPGLACVATSWPYQQRACPQPDPSLVRGLLSLYLDKTSHDTSVCREGACLEWELCRKKFLSGKCTCPSGGWEEDREPWVL